MLTEFQKQKLPLVFAAHDLNRDGVINRGDFEEYAARIANTRGWGPRSADYKRLLSRFLTFWNGLDRLARSKGALRVTQKEWLDHWDDILADRRLYEEIVPPIARTLFTLLDEDGDGAVTASEYAATYKHSGLDEADAAAAFERLDLDHDGRISIDEIITLTHQFFYSNNPEEPGNALYGILPSIHATEQSSVRPR